MSTAPSDFAFSRMSSIPIENAPSDRIMEDMAAGAFRALCEHLRLRGDQVQNIDLIAVGGFCRNCLAKWMVLEARKLSKQLHEGEDTAVSTFAGNEEECKITIDALDSFGYDEAAKLVYGESYSDWKKRHQKCATEEQLHNYQQSVHLHAIHDEDVLKKSNGVNAQDLVLSERVVHRLQAGAFLSLCHHLRTRSDEVQNIDLMNISGFCRNCLAKWLVVEARKVSNLIGADNVASSYFPDQQKKVIDSLDSFGYDEAAQYVYECTYPEWKRRHQKETTSEQMERYNASKHLHANHDNEILATRSSKNSMDQPPKPPLQHGQICIGGQAQQNTLLSDVCCQDVDTLISTPAMISQPTNPNPRPRPPKGDLALTVGILTISDRASANEYATGDLSGTAVESAMVAQIDQLNHSFGDQNIAITFIDKCIVADEIPLIKQVLELWSGKTADADKSSKEAYDLVFTTGGTGFAKRDVTPEATLAVLDRECQGLMSWASMELTSKQPLATLSRAVAGVCGNTLIVNLPGNPTGASQVVEFLLPLLLHAITDLRSGD